MVRLPAFLAVLPVSAAVLAAPGDVGYMELCVRDSLLKESTPDAVAKEDAYEALRRQSEALRRKLSSSGHKGRQGTHERAV